MTINRLLQRLPSLYQDNDFLDRFLAAFEKILFGRDPEPGILFPFDGLEESIAGLSTIFDPYETPEKFLEWLSDWTSFTLRSDLDITKQRDFIANIIQLYRRRGTKENLKKLLSIFTVGTPAVMESASSEFQIGVHSTIGQDTVLGGGAPHFFQVTISLPRESPESLERQMAIAQALIELEKPAHTHYTLEVTYPSMQIGVYSTIGVDTLLGTEINE